MKVIEYIRLGECAICPQASKKKEKDLICHWEDNEPPKKCSKIKKCGSFPKGEIDISKLEVEY